MEDKWIGVGVLRQLQADILQASLQVMRADDTKVAASKAFQHLDARISAWIEKLQAKNRKYYKKEKGESE